MLSVESYAQKGYELGGWAGTSLYNGDLNPSVNLRKPGIAGGLIYKYNFNSRVSLRGGISYGRVSAADSLSSNNFQLGRNLSFKSSIWDLSGAIEFNFFPLEHYSLENAATPFVKLGVNLFRYNPKAELNGTTFNLRDLGTEGQELGNEYFLMNAGFVIGGGYKWAIGNNIYIAVEGSMRFTATDYLDDVSTVYPDLPRLEEVRGETARNLSDRSIMDGIGIQGRQRGDSTSKDRYTFIGVSVMKYFGQLECPKIGNGY